VNVTKARSEAAKKFKLGQIPKVCRLCPRPLDCHRFTSMFSCPIQLMDIIAAVPESYRATLLPYLRAKPIRTASGIAVVVLQPLLSRLSTACELISRTAVLPPNSQAVMSKPHRCPHIAMTGNVCVYCPGESPRLNATLHAVVGIVSFSQVVLTVTLSTARRHTLGMSPPACEPYVPVTILTPRPVAVWIN
jgi:hypothetical protein